MRYYHWQEFTHDEPRFVRNLDWNLLKVFAEIVRSHGVTRAARVMCRQQPSVSNSLKRLERHLGVVLCQRGPSGFQLTEHGEILWKICQDIQRNIGSMPNHFIDIANSIDVQIRLLTVGNIVSEPLDTTLAQFCRRHPQAEILISVCPWSDVQSMVIEDEADIGICPVSVRNNDLSYTLLYKEKNVPVCGRNHPLYGTSIENPRDLKNETFALLGIAEAEPVKLFREKYGWGSRCIGQSLDPNEVKRIVLTGSAIAMLPREFLEIDIANGKLWQIMEPPEEAKVDISLVAAPSNSRFQAVHRFLEMFQSIRETEKVV